MIIDYWCLEDEVVGCSWDQTKLDSCWCLDDGVVMNLRGYENDDDVITCWYMGYEMEIKLGWILLMIVMIIDSN